MGVQSGARGPKKGWLFRMKGPCETIHNFFFLKKK